MNDFVNDFETVRQALDALASYSGSEGIDFGVAEERAALDRIEAEVERLRATAQENKWYAERHAEQAGRADGEVARLRLALEQIATPPYQWDSEESRDSREVRLRIRIARAALAKEEA